jgi:succinate dehydrogenase/fumarate reductase flavoprotein subunit
MKFCDSGAALAREIGCSDAHLASTFTAYSAAAAQGSDSYGKKYFQNAPITMHDNFHVAVITPVLHYCMGGIKVAPDTSVLTPNGTPVAGLFAAGEVMGGVHGENRLGGSSLFDCVVFGRVAGRKALQLSGAPSAAATTAACCRRSSKRRQSVHACGSRQTQHGKRLLGNSQRPGTLFALLHACSPPAPLQIVGRVCVTAPPLTHARCLT